jgi:hypothetical protein
MVPAAVVPSTAFDLIRARESQHPTTAMVRRLTLVLALGVCSCGGGGDGGGGGGGGPIEPPTLADGFEGGISGWTADADVPLDPNRPGETVAWSISASSEQAVEGSMSARYFLDGRQDDGTIWLVRPLSVAPSTTFDVHIELAFWSVSESFNNIAHVAVFAGPTPPSVEADFDLSARANDATGWLEYEWDLVATSDPSGALYIAIGISAVFETEMTYFIDNVRVWAD